MDLNKVNIEKLPADVRKTFRQLQVVENKRTNSTLQIIQKFLKQDYKKIVKQQDVGRHQMVVNTSQLVLVVRSRVVVQIY
jgi:hypothetical protein